MKKIGGYKKFIEIRWAEVDKLAQLQCTLEEIAWFFDFSVDTLARAIKRVHKMHPRDYLEQKRSKGRTKLRVKQMQVALAGSVPMLIFLGKQYLGQSDKVERIDEESKSRPVRLIIEKPKETEEQKNEDKLLDISKPLAE